jgi:hypothetical protein
MFLNNANIAFLPCSATFFWATDNLPLKLSITPKYVNFGEIIYPSLFGIYVNDCEIEFLNNCCQPV